MMPPGYDQPDDGTLAPQYVIERIKHCWPEAVYVAGVGQHQMWAAQSIDYENPGTWINSVAGTMGLRRACRDGRQYGPPGHRLGDRRGRPLPDDEPGASNTY